MVAKDARIDLRISERDKEVIVRAARACNLTTTEFIIKSSLLVAEKISEPVTKPVIKGKRTPRA